MRYIPPAPRRGLQRALVASAALHLAIVAGVIVLATWSFSTSQPGQAVSDTSVREVSLRLDAEESPPLAPAAPVSPTDNPAPVPEASTTDAAHPPTLDPVPNALSPQIITLIRRSQNGTRTAPVAAPSYETQLRPASGQARTHGLPLHGPLKATQSVVYLLDCSGSMGEFGKLDLARAALLATLEQQPADVRFQVIFYNSAVWRLLPGGLISVGAIRAAELKLATIEASGRSNHLEALRAAVALQTDAIVWLTDAGDLSAQKCKLVASEGAKPIRIYVAEVSARGVAAPRELR